MTPNEAKQLWPRYEARDINPLEAASLHHFNCKQVPGQSYRDAAIDDVVSKEMTFYSEGNCDFELMKRYVGVKCPYCNCAAEHEGGSACSGQSTHVYRCKGCGASVSLTIVGQGGFSARPGAKK